jgi:hypothetical protein
VKLAFLFFVLAAVLIFGLSACSVDTPGLEAIRDSRLLDRRISETPRQKVIRECKQEGERFRVDCMFCHTTNKLDEIQSPEHLLFTKSGERAQIMRKSPAFGLNQDCNQCHQTKFKLNRSAQKLYGPGGSRYAEIKKELQPDGK